jgi:hypothetical protein
VTEDDLTVLNDLFLARTQGLDAAIEPEYYPSAHRLMEKGWLERRSYKGDIVWRLSDRGMVSLGLAGLTRDDPADLN